MTSQVGTADKQDDWADRLGICSVTLRSLEVPQVLGAAVDAGLHRIEWGADIHAPPTEPDTLDRVRDATAAAGLAISSYGGYWRAGVHPQHDATELLDAAVLLGAPRVRVWAGEQGADEAGPDGLSRTADALREAAQAAQERGIEIGLEFHRNTLTDSVDSTLRLLDAVDHPALQTYWQPRVGEPAVDAVLGLERLIDRVCAVHVFSWWPEATRQPLAERADLWQAVLAVLRRSARPRDLLLEFVPDNDAAGVMRDAHTLRAWLGATDPGAVTHHSG